MERSWMRFRVAAVVLAAATAAGAGGRTFAAGAAGASPELRGVSTRLDRATSTVLIEASEPVAYVTSQPDPLTVFVDLRNVRAAGPGAVAGPVPPVSAVRVEGAAAADGVPVTRVRVALERPAPHRVRSSRNVIYVEVDRLAEKVPGTFSEPAREKV
ncbi:MAG: hypothetical protein AB1635_19210, partial [Acidobacteriota bacterium]